MHSNTKDLEINTTYDLRAIRIYLSTENSNLSVIENNSTNSDYS